MDAKRIAEALVDAALGPMPLDDELLPTSGLDIRIGNDWIPAPRELWSAWTGRRRVWGVEHHGPVYALGATGDAPVWQGARECTCNRCQSDVKPELRPN